MRKTLIGLVSVLLLPLSATATDADGENYFPQQISAQDLLTLCASSSLTAKGRARRSYCDGFVSGIEESMRLYRLRYTIESAATVCVPEGVTARALTEVYIRNASRKGADLSQPAAAAVLTALHAAFPC